MLRARERRSRKHSRSQRGVLMILMIVVTVFTLGWLSDGLRRSTVEHNAAILNQDSVRALHLAEAGLDQMIENLRTISGADDIYASNLPNGSFVVEEPLIVLEPLLYEANIHGLSGLVDRKLEAVFRVQPKSIFQYAAFGDEGVTISGSASIDSYDSSLDDPYGVNGNQNSEGDIGTNSTEEGAINMNGNNYYVDGQLSVGPDVDNPEDAVDGLNSSLVSADPPVISREEFPLPEVKIPDDVTCEEFEPIDAGTVRTLDQPVYCYGDMHIAGGVTLTSSGPVVIYLTGTLTFGGESTIGVVDDPTQFLFLMESGSSMDVSSDIVGAATMYAAIYGPDASIFIAGEADIFGSIVGNEVGIAGDAQLHYDEALRDVTTLSNVGTVELLSWREDG